MTLDILIVDDDRLARQRMRQLLSDCSLGLCGSVEEAGDAVRAAGLMRHRRFDLVLLDVQMPGEKNGLQLADSLRDLPQRPSVVFVTGYAQHALEAFDSDAIDYLTKPVRPERLERALVKAIGRRDDSRPAAQGEHNSLRIVHRGQTQRVPLSEVLYLRAESKRLTVVTTNGRFTMEGTLAELEERFPRYLLRVHRHTLAARSAIAGLRRVDDQPIDTPLWMLDLRGTSEQLPVARRMVANVRSAVLMRRH